MRVRKFSVTFLGGLFLITIFLLSSVTYADNETQFSKKHFTIVENGPAAVTFATYGIDITDNAYSITDSEFSSPIATVKHQVDFTAAQFGPNGEFIVPIHDTFSFADGVIVVDSTFRVTPITSLWIDPLASAIAPSAPSTLYTLSSLGGDNILSGNKDGVIVSGTGRYRGARGILAERGRYITNNNLPVFFDACTNTFHLQ